MQSKGGTARKMQKEQQALEQAAGAELHLSALDSYEAAERNLDALHRAVATGRLPAQAGGVSVRAIAEWIKARGSKLQAEEFTRLAEAVARLEAANDELRAENARLKASR